MGSYIKYYPNAKQKNVRHHTLDRPFIEPVEGGVRVRQATKQGYAFCKFGGVFDCSYPNSTIRRARVVQNGEICGCIMASTDIHYCVVEKQQ